MPDNERVKRYSDLLFSEDRFARSALEYLCDVRKLATETIREFSIGFCNDSSHERLTNRFVVPINSEFGEFLAFAARSFVTDNSDWWNEPFEKNNNFFMLDFAKNEMIKSGKVYLVEGYLDSLIPYQHGIKNICALMGVALGHRRIGILSRYCDSICLCFDTDSGKQSGQIARAKAIYELYLYGWTNISAICLPVGIDPDEFVIKHGAKEFLNLERKLEQKDIARVVSRYKKFTGKK